MYNIGTTLETMYPAILHLLSNSLSVTGPIAAGVVSAAANGGHAGFGGKTVMLDHPVYDMAAALAKAENISLRKFVNEYLGTALRKEQLVKKIGSYLAIVLVQDNHLYVNDDRIKDVVKVTYLQDEKKLECQKDGGDSCVHVAYCLNSNELGKLAATLA